LPEIVAITEALKDGLPEDPTQRTPEQQARALLAAAVDFHRREERPQWWQMFEWRDADDDTLRDTPAIFVADGASASEWGKSGRQKKERRVVTLTSDSQEPRDVFDRPGPVHLLYDTSPMGAFRDDAPRNFRQAEIVRVGSDIVIEEPAGAGDETWYELPIAVLPRGPVDTRALKKSLTELAQEVCVRLSSAGEAFPHSAWGDLLLGEAPRRRAPLPRTGDDVDDIMMALKTANSYVAVQGPPGTGKTYVGSHVVAQLASEGWRIGVVAQSHAVVENFLEAVCEADPLVPIGKEPQDSADQTMPWHVGKLDAFIGRQSAGFVIGGTAWTFCRESVRTLGLDLLVIDEAGQFSLASTIAVAASARRLLLLGDPQQLPQVSQGTHPEPVDTSALGWVMDDHAVIPADRGYFLARTRRMRPEVAEPVSQLAYEGQLEAHPDTALRRLDGVPAGVVPVPLAHTRNATQSPEEADEVLRIVRDIVGTPWTDGATSRPLAPEDVIVVTPYNAQQVLVEEVLTAAGFSGVRVGTVDRFQGQEAAVVIVSLAASSGRDAPRGLEFLLLQNRINVAVSRAMHTAFVVYGTGVLDDLPRTPDGVARLSAFARLVGATGIPSEAVAVPR
jgi:uncharacterized protein